MTDKVRAMLGTQEVGAECAPMWKRVLDFLERQDKRLATMESNIELVRNQTKRMTTTLSEIVTTCPVMYEPCPRHERNAKRIQSDAEAEAEEIGDGKR